MVNSRLSQFSVAACDGTIDRTIQSVSLYLVTLLTFYNYFEYSSVFECFYSSLRFIETSVNSFSDLLVVIFNHNWCRQWEITKWRENYVVITRKDLTYRRKTTTMYWIMAGEEIGPSFKKLKSQTFYFLISAEMLTIMPSECPKSRRI